MVQSFFACVKDMKKHAVTGNFQFKFASFYGRTELTWGLQTVSYDWSEFIKFSSFYRHIYPSLQITLRLVRII